MVQWGKIENRLRMVVEQKTMLPVHTVVMHPHTAVRKQALVTNGSKHVTTLGLNLIITTQQYQLIQSWMLLAKLSTQVSSHAYGKR